MVNMQVTHNDRFHISDIVACLRDLCIQLLIGCVVDSWEDVVKWSTPYFGVVLAGAGLEQDQTLGGMLDQSDDHDQLAADVIRVWITVRGHTTLKVDSVT